MMVIYIDDDGDDGGDDDGDDTWQGPPCYRQVLWCWAAVGGLDHLVFLIISVMMMIMMDGNENWCIRMWSVSFL